MESKVTLASPPLCRADGDHSAHRFNSKRSGVSRECRATCQQRSKSFAWIFADSGKLERSNYNFETVKLPRQNPEFGGVK